MLFLVTTLLLSRCGVDAAQPTLPVRHTDASALRGVYQEIVYVPDIPTSVSDSSDSSISGTLRNVTPLRVMTLRSSTGDIYLGGVDAIYK